MKRIRIQNRLLALFTMFIGPALMAESSGTAYLDKIVFGEEANSVRAVAGEVRAEMLHTEMGAFVEAYPVHTLASKGSALSFRVKAPARGESLILEFQEIHDRRPDAYGYTISVDGTELYFRTYQELGAGPSHFFVEVPSSLFRAGQLFNITVDHKGGGPFSLGTVWVWDNFFERVAEPESVYRKMGLLIPPGSVKFEGEPGADKGPREDDWWLRRFEALQERFANLRDFEPIGTLGFGGSYGGQDPLMGRETVRQGLRLSATTGMPGEMILNGLGWFSGPTGPDGLGGYFSDIRYDKSNYNEAKGFFQTSYPNVWGNTPGYTLRDPNLNHFLEKRFQNMMRGTAEKLAQLRLEGSPASPIFVREFAPASGEITDQIIQAAARDGVTLEPSDGLSFEERMWMHHDAVRTWQEYADGLLRTVGRDIVVVDQGKLHLPEEQTFDNFYAHPNFMTDEPVGDPRWGGGQHGMVDGLWSSGEIGATSGHRDIEEDAATQFRDVVMYDYLPANGKFASINLERTMLKEDFTVLRMYYERGAQFVTLFNADDGDERFVREVDGFSGDPVSPPPHAQPVVAMEPVEVGSVEGETSFHREELFRLTNAGDPFMNGFSLSLNGRVSPGDANRIEIFLGATPEDMALVTTLREADLPDPDHWTPRQTSMARVDLGESMVGKTKAYLSIVYHAEGARDAAFLIERKVETRWPRRSGYTGAPSLTRKDARTLQLWLQERSVARRLLRYYRDLGGEDGLFQEARELFDRGWYSSARRLLGPQISQVLPARYLVRGHGVLGRHPVEITLPDAEETVFVTLEQMDAEGILFSLVKDPLEGGEQSVSLRFSELDTSRRWIVETLMGGRYWLRPADPGQRDQRVEVLDAAVVATLNHADPSAAIVRTLPERLTAQFQGMQGQRMTVALQDLELMNYSESMTIPMVRDVPHTREAAVLEYPEHAAEQWPRSGDEVRLRIDGEGRITEIFSRYGYDKGRIAKFQPPVIVGGASNGWIELENGNRYELVFEKQSGHFNTVALQGPLTGYEVHMLKDAIKPGHQVEVFFSPYSAKGGLPRVIRVTQPRTVLLDVDYTRDEDGSWRGAAHRIDGVEVVPHRPEPNYLYRVEMPLMRPVEAFTPGSVVYRVEHNRPLKTTAVEFAARAFEASSRVTFFTSPDGENWTRIGQFDKTWQNNISQSLQGLPYQFLDLTPEVEGLTAFYLKVELAVNSADHRFCLAKLRVATEEEAGVVQVELLRKDRTGLEFRLQAAVETPCTVQIANLKRDAFCRVENTAPSHYAGRRVENVGDNTMKATGGTVALTLTAGPRPEPPLFPFEPVEKVNLARTSLGRYETETGGIQSLEPPSVVNGFSNGVIELAGGNRYELGYLPWWTKARIVGLEGLKSVRQEKIAQAFQPGSMVEIQYEPWVYKVFPPRIHTVSQPFKLLLDEDYVRYPEGWEQRAAEVDGLHVADYRGCKLYPKENFGPGHVVYRVVSDEPLRQTAVGFTGRLIMQPVNRVTFYVRTAKTNEWRKCGEYTTATPRSNSWTSLKIVNITDFV